MAFVDRLTADGSPEQISLAKIKAWLKIEHDLEDEILTDLRVIAVNEAFNYTQNDFNHLDDNGELVDDPIPFNCVYACIMLIYFMYENRGEVLFDYGSGTPLPVTYQVLLNPYRKLVGL